MTFQNREFLIWICKWNSYLVFNLYIHSWIVLVCIFMLGFVGIRRQTHNTTTSEPSWTTDIKISERRFAVATAEEKFNLLTKETPHTFYFGQLRLLKFYHNEFSKTYNKLGGLRHDFLQYIMHNYFPEFIVYFYRIGTPPLHLSKV